MVNADQIGDAVEELERARAAMDEVETKAELVLFHFVKERSKRQSFGGENGGLSEEEGRAVVVVVAMGGLNELDSSESTHGDAERV